MLDVYKCMESFCMYHWLTNYKLHSRVMTVKLFCGCLCLTIVDSDCIYRKLAAFFAHKNLSFLGVIFKKTCTKKKPLKICTFALCINFPTLAPATNPSQFALGHYFLVCSLFLHKYCGSTPLNT